MKVLQINSVCGVGSTGRIATDLHSILKQQGHESYIAYGRGEARNCENTIKIGNKLDNYLHVAQTRVLDRHGLGSYRATKKLIKQIEELNPDVIHLHNIHGYYINVKLLFQYLKRLDKPIVWTLHDCWSFTGHCAHFDYVGCLQWKQGCLACKQKRQYPSSIGISRVKNNYRLKKEVFKGMNNMIIVTPSEWLANLVKKSFLNSYPVRVINNGVDLEIFKPNVNNIRKKYNLEGKKIILGVASVWEEKKGYKYFLELSNLLEDNEQIILVGVTEKQKNTLPKNIIGIERTDSTRQLAEIYSAADIFVNPTLEDTFPTTNLEALACGTPVITFNTGGSIESIDNNCGIIIEKGNLNDMRHAITTIKKVEVTQMCVSRSKMYSKIDRFMEYIELYQKIQEKG